MPVLLSFIICGSFCIAQDTEKPLHLHDFSLLGGTTHDFISQKGVEAFEPFLSSSDYTQFTDSAYHTNSYGIITHTSGFASVGFNFRLYSKKKKAFHNHFILKTGLTYSHATLMQQHAYMPERTFRMDTLIPLAGNKPYYLDSAHGESVWLFYKTHSVIADFGLHFTTSPSARFVWTCGVNLSVGYMLKSISSQEYIRYDETIVTQDSNNVYAQNWQYSFLDSKQNTKEGFSGGISFSTSISLALSKTHEFWSRTKLFYEIRLGQNVYLSPEAGLIRIDNFKQGLGFSIGL